MDETTGGVLPDLDDGVATVAVALLGADTLELLEVDAVTTVDAVRGTPAEVAGKDALAAGDVVLTVCSDALAAGADALATGADALAAAAVGAVGAAGD